MTVNFHRLGMSTIAFLLASCGGSEPGTAPTVPVVSAPAPTPSATPTPPATPAPPPTAAPPTTVAPPVTAAPLPVPAPASIPVEPYTLGSLTYTLARDTPADKADAIRDAMDFAVAHTNVLGNFRGNVSVVYGASTPTADASYLGQIRFGGSIGRRVALHELAHWLGSGGIGQWTALVANGRFGGPLALARVRAFDGATAVVNADRAHFWPYGLNFDREFSETQRNTQMVSAQIVDMKLGGDATAAIAGLRRFQNRSSSHVLQGGANGQAPVQLPNATGTSQQWRVSFTDGFIMLVNADTGLALAATGSDAAVAMTAAANVVTQEWEMMPGGDGGWFLLRNRRTGTCIDNMGDLASGAPLKLWPCGFHPNQQWRLVR